jgi:hypothetical protein
MLNEKWIRTIHELQHCHMNPNTEFFVVCIDPGYASSPALRVKNVAFLWATPSDELCM